MSDELLNNLARTLAGIDDGALAALTSVGLVRRARKDLEKGEATEFDVAGDTVVVRVGDGMVTMPSAGPAAATCTCPAGKRCRHVLVATLFLQRELAARADPSSRTPAAVRSPDRDKAPDAGTATPAAPAVPAGRAELLALTPADLVKWVGRKTLREAAALLDAAPDAQIIESEAGAVTVRFPGAGVECRYLPGAGVGGMITTAAARMRDRYLAAAVLLVRRRFGAPEAVRDDVPTAGPSGGGRPAETREPPAADAPRSREEVLASARSLLEAMVAAGLSHPSASTRDRLRTLGVSAAGVQLHRLSLALRALADEVELLLRRAAQADEGRLFVSMARAYALCAALAAAGPSTPAHLLGRSRSRYDEIGRLDLMGLAAYPWRTKSGYEGLTVLFWDAGSRRWCSWSDSRPAGRDGSFSAVARYRQDLPWQGAGTAWRMSRSRLRLLDAARNDQHRLSASPRSQALLLGDAEPESLDFGGRAFDDWTAAGRYFASTLPAGLRQSDPLDPVVILRPAHWGRRSFAAAEQVLLWELHDNRGATLLLRLPYDDLTRPAIEALDHTDPAGGDVWGVVGRLERIGAAGLALLPFSLLRVAGPAEQRVQNLGLDFAGIPSEATAADVAPAPAPALPRAHDSGAEGRGDDDEADGVTGPGAGPGTEPVTGAVPHAHRAFRELEEHLQHLAEAGPRRGLRAGRGPTSLAEELRDLGLTPLADRLRDLDHGTNVPGALLKARYLCSLYGELAARASLEAGVGGFP